VLLLVITGVQALALRRIRQRRQQGARP